MQFARGISREFSGLESIHVPASVEILREKCFSGLDHLSSLTFEPGSKLREIENFAFANCRSLKSISLPASLAVIAVQSLTRCSIERIVIDEANPHYFVSGDFLVAFDGMRLIRCFGHSESVIVGGNIESLGSLCFSECKSLVTISFESDSRLSIFGESAFSHCSALESICIPAQVGRISIYSVLIAALHWRK
jgi:hypothetical protein